MALSNYPPSLHYIGDEPTGVFSLDIVLKENGHGYYAISYPTSSGRRAQFFAYSGYSCYDTNSVLESSGKVKVWKIPATPALNFIVNSYNEVAGMKNGVNTIIKTGYPTFCTGAFATNPAHLVIYGKIGSALYHLMFEASGLTIIETPMSFGTLYVGSVQLTGLAEVKYNKKY